MALLLLSLFLLLITIQFSCFAAQTNITLGSSLSATSISSWPSPSGRFAFGFYSKPGGFAIGVWLKTTPNRTIIWTANRDDPPVTEGSIRLTFDGRLLWSAPGGQEKPITKASEPAAFASMLDSGNFVLYNSNQNIIWSTFASPTDTILSGQSLPPQTQLFSSKSEADQSTGEFRLNNQKDGNLVLYPVDSTDTADDAYWDTGTFQNGHLLTLKLDNTGLLYLAGGNGSDSFSKNLTQPKTAPSPQSGVQIYYRATIDADGIFRLYSHTFGKNGSSTTVVEWAALNDRCLVRGVCGLNSFCVLDANGEPNCRCPSGFDFVDSSQILLGCTRSLDKALDGCSKRSSAVAPTMVTMANTTWVDRSYRILPSTTSLEDCKAACLADCFCEAALYKDGVCTKQATPLRYGRSGSNDTLFIKVGSEQHNNQATVIKTEEKLDRLDALVGTAVFAAFSIILLAVSVFLIHKHWRRVVRYSMASMDNNLAFNEDAPLRLYSYEELERMTEHFKEELGRGAFGTVFKGEMPNGERAIAVKRLEKMVEDGEREFQREVRAIGRTSHKNLVRLFGFCNEGSNRLLVYEFMSNGSLANLLFNTETPPNWQERVKIALDVARGLHYLHEELESQIIHCDIKPQNVLIDDGGNAKISDFGLAKLLMPDQTRTFTGIRGTRGYLAPEWQKNTPISVKADVFSFGIVLLEIVCCKRSLEWEGAGLEMSLCEWFYECLVGAELGSLLGEEVVDMRELERMVKVGLWCVQNEPSFRPSMKNVILMLEGNTKVSHPPPPPSFS